MSGLRFGLTRLVFGVLPLLLAFWGSAFIVPTVQAGTCTLQVVSSATFPLTAFGSSYGTVTLSKYLDECGNEQGVLSANLTNGAYPTTGGGVSVQGVTSVSGISSSMATQVVFVGTGTTPLVCGGISVEGPMGYAHGGGCTPN
ncbi:MAG TPA: hypothetical protein VFN35_16455 [Ktedonobacteraceae bacterium]|nr:hypothetical protein [Ktedonobacteraceae bacterium]